MDSLIQNALAYYDKGIEKYKKIFEKIDHDKTLLIKSTHDLMKNHIELYDKNGNKMLTAEYECIGEYFNNLWIWSWAYPLDYNESILAKKILNYGVNLNTITVNDKKSSNFNTLNIFLKSELVTSRIYILNKIQLEIHIAIAGYLCKNPIIFVDKQNKLSDENNYIINSYYFLSNIKLNKL